MREVLVRDLSKCINCESCVNACRFRHGRARISMIGERVGHYELLGTCRHCEDAPCLRSCEFGGMRRDGDIVYVADACRGCKQCVVVCPYGAVTLVPRHEYPPRRVLPSFLANVFQAQAQTNRAIRTDARRCVQCGICSAHCPEGINVRDYTRTGRTVDDPHCIACGLCVVKCPRRALQFEMYPELPVPHFRADKCNLCRGYPTSACVNECPTGALQRVSVEQELPALNEQMYQTI